MCLLFALGGVGWGKPTSERGPFEKGQKRNKLQNYAANLYQLVLGGRRYQKLCMVCCASPLNAPEGKVITEYDTLSGL